MILFGPHKNTNPVKAIGNSVNIWHLIKHYRNALLVYMCLSLITKKKGLWLNIWGFKYEITYSNRLITINFPGIILKKKKKS